MPNKQIQSLTVEGVTYDIVDNTSGYINAQYIENKTDYEIPVSRVGEIVVGETAIGTDSTNFPTSKAVVDYVDERVVQEMDAIDVGVTSVNGKTGSVTLSASDLDNDMGFITSDSDEKLVTNTVVDRNTTYHPILGEYDTTASTKVVSSSFFFNETPNSTFLGLKKNGVIYFYTYNNKNRYTTLSAITQTDNRSIKLPDASGTIALTTDIPTVPTNISSFTNDSGYLTASDIASVMTYKGTKANYAALPASGNTTGDVWHLTDTGAEWAWDGSAWQELGTAIDLSNYATKATTLAGYGITDAKIENGTITLGSNTITPLTSFTETDPTVPSWAKASTKPSYGLTEISGTDDLRAIEALTGTSGFLKKTAANTWTLDTNTYLTSYTETDPTVPSWAKASTKPTYTAAEVGALPDSTVIPSKTSDLTNDSGFITSYTDEKVKVTTASTEQQYYLTFLSSGTTPITTTLNAHIGKLIYEIGTNTSQITLGNTTTQGRIKLFSGTGSNIYTRIQPASLTTNQTITLPNKSGTVALTSDIPQVYSSTNTGGYLTMATLPIYDGTVV